MRSVMNGLRVPWAWYTLPLPLPLFSMEVMGSWPIISPIYLWLTMVSYENFELACALGMHLKNSYTRLPWLWNASEVVSENSTRLSTPSSLPPPLISIFLTLTSHFTLINTLEPYIPQKLKTTYQPSTVTSPFSPIQTISSSHIRPCPSTTTDQPPLSSFFGPLQWNKYLCSQKTISNCKNTSKDRWEG